MVSSWKGEWEGESRIHPDRRRQSDEWEKGSGGNRPAENLNLAAQNGETFETNRKERERLTPGLNIPGQDGVKAKGLKRRKG